MVGVFACTELLSGCALYSWLLDLVLWPAICGHFGTASMLL